MKVTLVPKPKIVALWRGLLVCFFAIPAIAFSVTMRPGSNIWIVASAMWLFAFLFLYLFYLPARMKGISLTIEESRLIKESGVFVKRLRVIPFESIQYVTVLSSPLHKMWKLSSIAIVVPGAEIYMPGLGAEEAERVLGIVGFGGG